MDRRKSFSTPKISLVLSMEGFVPFRWLDIYELSDEGVVGI